MSDQSRPRKADDANEHVPLAQVTDGERIFADDESAATRNAPWILSALEFLTLRLKKPGDCQINLISHDHTATILKLRT
jgi:hypothetical protein